MDSRRFISKDADETAVAISKFINNYGADLIGCAYAMSKDHRYLVGQTFNMILYYIIQLNENYINGLYDGRNEATCRMANIIINHLKEVGILDDMYYQKIVKELENCRLNRYGVAD